MLLPALLLSFLSLTSAVALRSQKKPSDAVLLNDIQTLTLHAKRQTSARRVSSIPQLRCIGGSARNLYEVDVMRCKNSGTEYDTSDVQWTCTAQLPKEFKLGGTEVICEGYDSPQDPYVLKGSCGVEYRLVLTEEGERRYGHRKDRDDGEGGGNEIVGQIIFYLVVAFFLFIIFRIVRDVMARRNGRGRGEQQPFFPGGGGGGGPDDDNDPPPPYTPSDSKKSASGQAGQQQPWRPGFWTGAGAGAAAGYAAGNYRNNQTQRFNNNNSPFNNWASSSQPSSSRSGSSSSNHSTSFSSTRYESTGFGGSSRR